MADTNNTHTHHHHHHHKKDGSSLFKQRSLANIRRRKILEKVLKITLMVIAVLMACAVVFVYTVG
jgi:cell division protein FtsL